MPLFLLGRSLKRKEIIKEHFMFVNKIFELLFLTRSSAFSIPEAACYNHAAWGISAVGSASHWQCGGHGFKSRILHHKKRPCHVTRSFIISKRSIFAIHVLLEEFLLTLFSASADVRDRKDDQYYTVDNCRVWNNLHEINCC